MKHLPSLDGLRAISILMVVSSHLIFNGHIAICQSKFGIINLFLRNFYDGQLGVNIFFVLSGFIITMVLNYEYNIHGEISLKKFYVRRLLRIFPAYYFLLIVYFILQKVQVVNIEPQSWLTAITYTKYLNHALDWETGHAWTLSIEENFYLLWPLIYVGGRFFQVRFALGIVLIVPLIRTIVFFYPISFVNEHTIFYRIDAIAIGCLTALFKDQIISVLKPFWKVAFPLSLISLLSLRASSIVLEKIHMSWLFIPFGTTSGTFANLLIALLLLFSVYESKGLCFKLLNSKIMRVIGAYSYSIYLWQQFFLKDNDYWTNSFPLNIILITICVLISYHLVEKPFVKLKNRFNN